MVKGLGVILAGGKATRLGGISKANILIGDQTCLMRAQRVLAQGLNDIAVSGKVETHLKTLSDWPDEERGGVALAVLGALDWAQKCGYNFIITLPVDTPFVPLNFTHDLNAEFKKNTCSVTFRNSERVQGLHALWPVTCLDELKVLILEQGICKIEMLHEKLGSRYVHFSDEDHDPFFNLNTQADIETAHSLIKV